VALARKKKLKNNLNDITRIALTDLTPTDTIDTALTDDLTVKESVKAVSITDGCVKSVKAIKPTSVKDLSEKEKFDLFKEIAEEYGCLPFSILIGISDYHLQRLGKSVTEAQADLIARYGKKSRQILNDEEMFDYLNYLSAITNEEKLKIE
jgi:hypothetical protein